MELYKLLVCIFLWEWSGTLVIRYASFKVPNQTYHEQQVFAEVC